MLPFPSINYCDFMGGHLVSVVGTLQTMIDGLAAFGNLLSPCPMLPGIYYMKDYFMDETASPLTKLLPENVKYMTNFTLTDENARKPVLIATYQVLFTCNRSNWRQ